MLILAGLVLLVASFVAIVDITIAGNLALSPSRVITLGALFRVNVLAESVTRA